MMAESDPGVVNAGLVALLEAHQAELLRFLAARCGVPADAEDLLQELWLKAATVDVGPIANGRAYLFRMANNLVLDRARMRRRAMSRDRAWLDPGGIAAGAVDQQPDTAPDAEAALINAEEAALVRRAIAALPEGARRALLLYRFDGLGQAEIASIMGISRSGVEKHLVTAMKHLRRSLSDCGYYGATTSPEQESAGDAAPNRNRQS
jgi:RNA polymerase sigma-70 factor (ECF subfamily)